MAFAKIGSSADSACGRSRDPSAAVIKASAEAQEWAACGHIPQNLTEATIAELKNAVDPREIVNYHPHQYARDDFQLKPFDETRRYLWIVGRDEIGGKQAYILSDCVYFPYVPKTPRYTHANSSGTAAHPNRTEAIKNAALELVERDAFTIVWLNRLKMPRVSEASLPADIQKRVRALRRAGFRIVVKNFTMDLAPVLFVFAQNETLPMTTCAARSAFDREEALDHALMEVEAAAHCRLHGTAPSPISPRAVHFTDDHGNLYGQRRFFRRANFLADGGASSKFHGIVKETPWSWADLLGRFDASNRRLIAVDLTAAGTPSTGNLLKIVKVFIPGLVPMSFGYGIEPCGMERIYSLPVALGFRRNPMTYGKLTKFPHPYT